MDLDEELPEKIIFSKLRTLEDKTSVNMPKSDEFVVNSRGLKLHVRTYLPNGQYNAVVFFIHGYASHTSRPTHKCIGESFAAANIAYVTLDFHGHGYSEGFRCFVASREHLIEDVLCVISATYSKPIFDANLESKLTSVNVPFFLMGHSMGGGTSILVADILSNFKQVLDTKINGYSEVFLRFLSANKVAIESIREKFSGCILCAPLIELQSVNPTLRWVICDVFAKFIPKYYLPEFLVNENLSNESIWIDQSYIDYVMQDGYPNNKNGLSYGGNIRFQSVSTLLTITDQMTDALLSRVNYPFVIFHDPNDVTCKVAGVERLMEVSKTEKSNKLFVQMNGALHDCIANRLGYVICRTLEWLKNNLK